MTKAEWDSRGPEFRRMVVEQIGAVMELCGVLEREMTALENMIDPSQRWEVTYETVSISIEAGEVTTEEQAAEWLEKYGGIKR